MFLAAVALIVGAVDARGQSAFSVVAPSEGAEIALVRPVVVFATGRIDNAERARIRLFLDDTDVTEFLVWGSDSAQFRSPMPVPDGSHSAELRRRTADGSETGLVKVSFRTAPPRRRATVDGKIGDNPTLELASGKEDTVTLAPHADGSLSTAIGELRFTLDWTQPILLGTSEQALAPINALAVSDRARARLAAGLTEDQTFSDAAFFGMRTHRRIVEAAYGTPRAGRISAFTNLADAAGSAAGERSFDQWIQGVFWEPPIRTDRVTLRLLGEHARDRSGLTESAAAFVAEQRGLLWGALMQLKVTPHWTAIGEAAMSRRTVQESAVATNSHDGAYRGEVRGIVANNAVEARVSRVGARFGNPGDAGLKSDRQEGDVIVSRTARRWNYKLAGGYAYDGVGGAVEASRETRYGVAAGVRPAKNLDATFQLDRQSVEAARFSRAQTKSQFRLMRGWARGRMELRVTDSETDEPLLRRRARATGIRVSGRHTLSQGSSVSGGGGLEWRDEPRGDTQIRNLFLEPSWKLRGALPRVGLNLAYNSTTSPRSDTRRFSGKTSVLWELPPRWRRTALSVDVGWDHVDDQRLRRSDTSWNAAFKVAVAPEWTIRIR